MTKFARNEADGWTARAWVDDTRTAGRCALISKAGGAYVLLGYSVGMTYMADYRPYPFATLAEAKRAGEVFLAEMVHDTPKR